MEIFQGNRILFGPPVEDVTDLPFTTCSDVQIILPQCRGGRGQLGHRTARAGGYLHCPYSQLPGLTVAYGDSFSFTLFINLKKKYWLSVLSQTKLMTLVINCECGSCADGEFRWACFTLR